MDFANPKRAESRFLYDQLVTVGFQRLDALYDQDIVPINEVKATEWREKITELATAPDGAIPLEIVSSFDKYRYDTATESVNSSPIRIIHIDKTQNIDEGIEAIS